MNRLLPLLSLLALFALGGCATTETNSAKDVQVEESSDSPKTSAVYLNAP